jgi:dCMP deaminase
MACDNCDRNLDRPGRVIGVTPDLKRCAICGDDLGENRTYIAQVIKPRVVNRWDSYFHSICETVASKSPCLSRKIGAILVLDKSIISTGYNGPPRGIPHCGKERWIADDNLRKGILVLNNIERRFHTECPRKILGYESGTHMELCPAQHAEENCVSNAARLGVSVFGSTLYMNCIIPCKNCLGTLINAGIIEIVVDDIAIYDSLSKFIIDNSNIHIRKFEL